MKKIARHARWLLGGISLMCCVHLYAEEPFYDRLRSLTTTNDTGPSPTDPRLKDKTLLDNGEVAGLMIGMNMSEVVAKWGKPKLFYSTCMGGPLFDYPGAALHFHGDTLTRVDLNVKSSDHRTITNSPAQLRTNQTHSEYYQTFVSLIDPNNAAPLVTNSWPRGRLIVPNSVAGVTAGMKMPKVIELWGKPRVIWTPSKNVVYLGYEHFSLEFEGDEVKGIWSH